MPELFLAGVPGSFRYRRCDRHVYAMQHFPALPSTFFRYSRFSGVRGLCPVRAGSDMYHGRQGEQTHFRKAFRSGYGQLHDGDGLRGKRVVIVDDLLTSGDSLLEYAHNLERVGAIVTGAVFLARTFRMPSPATVRRVVWKHHLSALLTGK